MRHPTRVAQKTAFTLIELLIVVAIIAILAAIAVPNFLEAQTRAKISRMQADMRTINTALEVYAVDYNKYPPDFIERTIWGVTNSERWDYSTKETFIPLTTPVAYITSADSSADIFQEQKPFDANVPGSYGYLLYVNFWPPAAVADSFNEGQGVRREGVSMNWILASFGPDAESSALNMTKPINLFPITGAYDASNGTVSLGDIARFN